MKQKANTAVICLSPYHGGMELDALRISKLLSDTTDVTLIAKSGAPLDKNYRKEAIQSAINFETIPFVHYFSISIILNARRIVKDRNIKNVIFFGASEMRSLYFAFLGLNINLIIRHGTTKSTPKKDLFHRLIYSKVNWHIAICEHLKSNVLKIIPMGKNTQVKVIYSSLRHMPDIITKRKRKQFASIHLLYIGRITDGKGIIDAIYACETLHNKGIKFEFNCVGDIDPNYNNLVMEAISAVPYKDSINLPGFTSDVSKYLKTSDIFIFPSKGEGLSNSFIEALSYGLICISYANTSFPELQQAGFEFFMAEDGNVNELKSSLFKAVEYLKTSETPLFQNIKLAQDLFSRKRELDEILQILL
jgi:glycosyltransferase involved in cell wall biosynthesis